MNTTETPPGTRLPRTLPKKITELGRLRIGERVPNASGKGTHPSKIDCFRLTSSNKPLLHCAAQRYGGEVRPWVGDGVADGQFELYTTVNAIDVLVPTASAISVSYERWRAGGCTLRCTGNVVTHSPLDESAVGGACLCPDDDHERDVLAKKGNACARILRLNVLLPDLPGMGCWRLETKGYYATAELLASLDMLRMAEHQIIEAVLRLEWRQVKRLGKDPETGKERGTLQFAVPVLWPKYTPRQMLAAADRHVLLMNAPPQEDLRQLTAGIKAAEDIYGRSDVLREVAENVREVPNFALPAPTPTEANPFPDVNAPVAPGALQEPSPDVDADPKVGGARHRHQIEAVLRSLGPDEATVQRNIESYWRKRCTTYQVADKTQIPPSALPGLLRELREWVAKNHYFPMADWRAALAALQEQVDEPELLGMIEDALHDPATPDDIGRDILARVQAALPPRVEE
jgi:hypothetical protein